MAGTITALVMQKRNKKRVNVYLDGEFAFGLALIEAMKLHQGQHLSDDEIARLKSLDAIETAHEQALSFLSYRPRSTQEVRHYLLEKTFAPDTVEAVIERLQRTGLLDDEAFARFWVENREQFSPRSRQALRYELRHKGIPDGVAEGVLTGLDEDHAAYQAARERARRYLVLDEATFRKRLGNFLARRGFAYSTIRDVVQRLWQERNADDDTDTEREE